MKTNKIKVRNLDNNKIQSWTLEELLTRINEDNATDKFNYNYTDWLDGFNSTLLEFYSLYDEKGNKLNLLASPFVI